MLVIPRPLGRGASTAQQPKVAFMPLLERAEARLWILSETPQPEGWGIGSQINLAMTAYIVRYLLNHRFEFFTFMSYNACRDEKL